MNLGELRDRLAGAWEILRYGRDVDIYEVGKPFIPAGDGPEKWLPRCRKCGIPRGTLRHALLCTNGACDDPDATR